jgi:transcriptional antiterminator RfaH
MTHSINVEPLGSGLLWYAVHTHPKEEDRAANNLAAGNVETFNPKIKKCRFNPFTGAAIYESKPLFPRYIFARFDAPHFLSKVSFTRGVKRVVSFGGGPVPINDEIIGFIRSQVRENGFVELGPKLKRGDDVMIKDGPLNGLQGIFEHEVKGTDRVMILLKAISYQGSIVIEKEHVEKVNTSDQEL